MVSASAYVAIFGWFLVGPLIFYRLRGRWGILVSMVVAWLFLPMAEFDWSGLPPIDKLTTTSGVAMLSVLLFDWQRLLAFRPRWIDLPMAIWCFVPFVSILLNGPLEGFDAPRPQVSDEDPSLYDAVVMTITHTVKWGVPYLLGRLYLRSSAAHRDFLIALMLGGLIYIPLCVFEMRMSTVLHLRVYGILQHDFSQTIRWGMNRPMVFMEHPLMVGFWMMSTTLAAITLWRIRAARKVWGVPTSLLIAALVLTTIMCLSLGAWVHLVIGIVLLWAASHFRMSALLAGLALIPILYIGLRVGGGWDGGQAVGLVESMSPERADSLQFRIDNEDILADHALERPWFGWAGYKRNRVYDDWGKDVSVSDGLWVLALGLHGIVGLVSLFTWLLLPAVLSLIRAQWFDPLGNAGCTITVALIVLLFAMDSLPNAMQNPIYILAVGGLASYVIGGWKIDQQSERDAGGDDG